MFQTVAPRIVLRMVGDDGTVWALSEHGNFWRQGSLGWTAVQPHEYATVPWSLRNPMTCRTDASRFCPTPGVCCIVGGCDGPGTNSPSDAEEAAPQ